ncbi:hypothetical protein ABZ467_26065 [Streptomyces sp. NPDC005727]|uniref:hypothetical protein n=1 Tax=unclassified Streptomyces TaxID=2593676 RepID=UPI0033FCA0B1
MDATEPDPTHVLPLPDLVEARLAADTKLSVAAKALVREALGGSEGACTTVRRPPSKPSWP